MIYEHLKTGKENALSTVYLMNITGITSEREFRKQIAIEREAGLLIISSKSGGYYLPANRQELLHYVSETEKAINSLKKSLQTAKTKLNDFQIDGQLEMNFSTPEDSEQHSTAADQKPTKKKSTLTPEQKEVAERARRIREQFGIYD